jgi:hypothetical protein
LEHVLKTANGVASFDFFASFCCKVSVFFEGDCEGQPLIEEDRPRKGRKDTETESRFAPTRLDVTQSRTALSTLCIPSVLSVLSVVKSSSFLSGCWFADGKSTGRSFCGFAAWRELPRSFLTSAGSGIFAVKGMYAVRGI